ncbi:proton channel OTOP3 [Rhineura floridana]|uniref:proton channel OTOP3 n=1 Tax=Rhineura floridana TaxID=261503 RepID=UPI002AC854F1|nr:proton channel OTOP3 [Rhineura floridana]XP_061472097.1 proton channel OTOP3 [Rhineura floridana]
MDLQEAVCQRHHRQEAGGNQPAPPQPEGWKINYEKSWLHRHCSSLLRRDKQAQKAGQLFSGLLAMNVVFLGCAFICSMIFNKVVITLKDVWIFLSILKILALVWIACYLLFTRRKPHAILYRDAHAGPVWVKGSLILFGVCSVLLHVIRIGYDIIHIQCKSQVDILFPSLGILFICIQTYFIWCHAKDCTQVQHNFTRCGLMLTLATNLLLWLLAVTDDSVHREIESELNHSAQGVEGNGTGSCKCSNTTACKVFQKGYILLYPFNTEYCLICCSMLYVMWKNVGRRIAQHHISCTKPRFKLHGVIFGPLLGISAIIIGICIFMVYQIQATSSSPSQQTFILYYSYYIFLLPVMTVGALVGTIIHGLEERELDTLKNPTRSLDVILLMGAALGQIGISYFSIVAIVATNPTDLLNSIILAYSVSLIMQHITQNIFIIEGLHRQPLLVDEGPSHAAHSMKGFLSAQSPPSEHMIASYACQEPASSTANKKAEKNEKETCENTSPKVYNLEIRQEIRKVSQTYIQTYSHLNWKRKALKEISSFLIMCNIILWILPSFGAHPVFENGLEKSFYGYSTWFAIVNFGLPLGVFYRMHSVGDLLEVYRST